MFLFGDVVVCGKVFRFHHVVVPLVVFWCSVAVLMLDCVSFVLDCLIMLVSWVSYCIIS